MLAAKVVGLAFQLIGTEVMLLSVSVNVAANATSPQVNQASVAGGGMSGSASANDSTIISGLAPDAEPIEIRLALGSFVTWNTRAPGVV